MKTNCGMLVVTMASLLTVSSVMARPDDPVADKIVDVSADNPGNLYLTEMREGAQNVITLLEKNQAAHAADENLWFHSRSVYSEYTYTDSRDERLGGFTSEGREGTVGLNFLTICDVAVSLMGTYGQIASDTRVPGEHNVDNGDNYGLTLTVAKNCDWLLFGASAGYDRGYFRTRTPNDGIFKLEPDAFTVAPFVGVMYVNGNFSFSSVPAYMFTWIDQDYDSTGPTSSDDHNNQETFVWMNTVNYNLCEKLGVGVVADWNRLTHYKKNMEAVGDREWLTVGPKLSYQFTPAWAAYASITKDLNSGTYKTWQAIGGLNYGF